MVKEIIQKDSVADVGASGAADDVGSSGGLTGETNGLKSHVHGTLHSRMSPSSIVQVMESISDNQLKAIKDIRFGSIEYLKVTQLPLQLGLFLVHHFDAHTCSLKIPNSDPFPMKNMCTKCLDCRWEA
uniref:Uncharacterized protein n=1 Tax=Chenopodium quinoa TaxID=63459 RepID=A0A803N2R8_CHEQI